MKNDATFPAVQQFPTKIRILYASQTGQAESISQIILERLREQQNGTDADIERHCVSQFERLLDDFWKPSDEKSNSERFLLVIVASTTGQGDPPDKAIKFYRWLRRFAGTGGGRGGRQQQQRSETTATTTFPLKHLSYALLGLGDTNYDNFCQFGKQLNRLLAESGATPFVSPAFADDAVGLELVTEPFVETLLHAVAGAVSVADETKPNAERANFSVANHHHHVSGDDGNGDGGDGDGDGGGETNNFHRMNINRPVVSSCAALSSADKRTLSDLCRQLVEPSPVLAGVDQLDLPKTVTVAATAKPDSDVAETEAMVYGEKDLDEFHSSLDRITVQQYLQSKVLHQTAIHRGQVMLTKILSNETESERKKCCHRKKTVLECQVEYEDNGGSSGKGDQAEFVPGDSFGIYSANLLIDVYQMMMSCRVRTVDTDESILLWDYLKGNRKRVFVILADKKTVVELLPYLVYGVDLRTIPKKATICHLAQYTGDWQQKRRLLELSSKQGNAEYQKLILGQNITICDILRLFDTCQPPINILLGHLMPAKPRYFTAASLPMMMGQISAANVNADNVCDDNLNGENDFGQRFNHRRQFRIVFSVANNFSHTFMRTSEHLLGLFSGKFFRHYNFLPKNYHPDLHCGNVWKTIQVLHENVQNGSIFDGQDVPVERPNDGCVIPAYIFRRTNKTFRLPPVPAIGAAESPVPVILIATGTGMTPFLAYLEAVRQYGGGRCSKRDIFFLFGCRHPYQDFSYSERLISYARGARTDSAGEPSSLIHHFCVCFSRCSRSDRERFEHDAKISLCGQRRRLDETDDDTSSCSSGRDENEYPKHVDQLILVHGAELADWIVNRQAMIYVCGNWKIISAGIVRALTAILARHHFGCSDDDDNDDDDGDNHHQMYLPEAGQYLKQMQKSGRFLQDIWT